MKNGVPIAFSMDALAHAFRAKKIIKPFRVPVKQRHGLPRWDLSGLTTEVARIDVDAFIRHYLPDYRGSFPQYKPGIGPPAWKDSRWVRDTRSRPVLRGGNIDKLRLRCLVILSRLAVGKVTSVTRDDVDCLRTAGYKDITQEYLENVALIDPMDLDLPAVAYAYPLDKGVAKIETSPQRALAIISRTAAGLFLGGHSPYLQDFSKDGPIRYALLAPRPPEG